MNDWQERVTHEKRELDERLDRLNSYLAGGSSRLLAPEDRNLLQRQRRVMEEYSEVLRSRIERF